VDNTITRQLLLPVGTVEKTTKTDVRTDKLQRGKFFKNVLCVLSSQDSKDPKFVTDQSTVLV
jgi:hypothetical protein